MAWTIAVYVFAVIGFVVFLGCALVVAKVLLDWPWSRP